MLPGGRDARLAHRRRSRRCRCMPTLFALSLAVLVVLWLRSAAAVVSPSSPVPEPDARAPPVRLGSARAAEAPSTERAEVPVPESITPADDAPAGLRNAEVVVGVMTCARFIGTRCRTQVCPAAARTPGPTRTAHADATRRARLGSVASDGPSSSPRSPRRPPPPRCVRPPSPTPLPRPRRSASTRAGTGARFAAIHAEMHANMRWRAPAGGRCRSCARSPSSSSRRKRWRLKCAAASCRPSGRSSSMTMRSSSTRRCLIRHGTLFGS